MKRLLLTLALAAMTMNAETVFMSAHGKTFHKTAECNALARATHVYSAERSAAEAHQLHACGRCYHTASTKAKPASIAWASEVQRTTPVETDAKK